MKNIITLLQYQNRYEKVVCHENRYEKVVCQKRKYMEEPWFQKKL